MGMDGADLTQLDELARRFTTWSGQVEQLKAEITGAVNALVGVSWTGQVALGFRDQWNGEFAGTLLRLADALQQQARFVQAKREQFDLVANRS